MTVTAAILTGCRNNSQQIDGIESYIAEVKDITVPEQVQIIGPGEATHGNRIWFVLDRFIEEMDHNKETYIADSDKKVMKLFMHVQYATIQSGNVSYNDARDKYMADKIEDIMSMENGKRIMISGRNGHIQAVE